MGPLYKKRTALPRLLFLSLDSGSAAKDPQKRTAEAVRQGTLDLDVEALRKNEHWYRTHEMAHKLLHQFKPELTISDTPWYFAHVNSAKCCQNKAGRERADSTLFENCRPFIPEELRILKPDIVVTQGDWARTAVCQGFDIQQHVVRKEQIPDYKHAAHYETGLIYLESNGKTTLWLHTYHPTAYGLFYPQRAHCWPLYAKKVGRFWRSRRGS